MAESTEPTPEAPTSARSLLIGFGAGVALGSALNWLGKDAAWIEPLLDGLLLPIGQLFLRSLFMLVLPMLFSAIVVGIAELDVRSLGKLGLKTLGLATVFSTIAVVIGLVMVNSVGPGRGLDDSVRSLGDASAQIPSAPASGSGLQNAVLALVPDNPVKAAANGDMLGMIVFSILFGIGASFAKSDAVSQLVETIRGLYDVSMRLVSMVLKLAPLGVGALVCVMTARAGFEVFRALGSFVLVVLSGLLIHSIVTYSAAVWLLGGMAPWTFFRGSRLAIVTAFATASSNATLPTSLIVAERDLGLPKKISRFVLTAGASMNQNGTALFEGVTVLFLAQVYGVDLSLGQQLGVMLTCVLAGIGTAGVPAGSLPVIAMILQRNGIPAEGLGLILGVDRFLDMCRTTVNVAGDLAIAAAVARSDSAADQQTS
ncbi:MAG: dicarboxylate/amino acid:cation symporter [Deltaproteobacteria bacterium]|nr:dicarboxylate/amino acid:cation symporter [Deltaproteobacteria bacterium]